MNLYTWPVICAQSQDRFADNGLRVKYKQCIKRRSEGYRMKMRGIGTSLLALVLAASLFIGALPAAADGTNVIGTILVTNANYVNVRTGGDTSYPIVAQIPPGSTYQVIGIASSGWFEIVLDDGTTGYVSDRLTTFTPNGTGAPVVISPYIDLTKVRATINVSYRSDTGQQLAAEYVQLAYGSNLVSANDSKVPAGYTLLSSRRVTVYVSAAGVATPSGIIFTYAGGYVAPTQVPQGYARVPVYYKDIYGALLNSSYADLVPGSSLISANNAMVPAGYTLVGARDAVVSVSVYYIAIPSSVTFLYTRSAQPTQAPQASVVVPVYYMSSGGGYLNTVYLTLGYGMTTVRANNALVPGGYSLISPASVNVQVNAYNVASPSGVVFTYQAQVTQAPIKVVNIPVYYKGEDGSLLNTVYVTVTQGINTVQADNGNVPNGYARLGESSQQVFVDANGYAVPSSVTFTYRLPLPPIGINIPVIYRDHTGAQINATQAWVTSNVQNKVTADSNFAPAGWVLISAGSVTVTLTQNGVATPPQVVFTYQDPATITNPVFLPNFVKTKPNAGSYPVYTGPGPGYYRVGNATLGGGTIRVYGREGDWALIGYGLSNGGYRIGFVEMAAIPADIQPQYLTLVHMPKTNVSTSLFVDDPIVSTNRELEKRIEGGGNPFTLLAYLNDFWAYVEIANFEGSGMPARGFVSRRSLGVQ